MAIQTLKRYVVTFDMYIWADTDADAIKQGKKFAKEISEKDDSDNGCSMLELVEQPFGTLTNRKIKI